MEDVQKKKISSIEKAAFALLLLLLLILAVVLMSGGLRHRTGPGMAVPAGGNSLYYVSSSGFLKQRAVCLYDPSAGKSKRLIKNASVYSTSSGPVAIDANGFVYRLSGTEIEKIGRVDLTRRADRYLELIGNDMYFIAGLKTIYRENIQTGEVTEIISGIDKYGYINDPGFCGSKLFYTDTGDYVDGRCVVNIYTCDMQNHTQSKVFEISSDDGSDFTGAFDITCFDDFFIVAYEDGILKVDAEDYSCEKLADIRAYSVSLHDGRLYYVETEAVPSGNTDPTTGEVFYDHEQYLSYIDLADGKTERVMNFDRNSNTKQEMHVTDEGVYYIDPAGLLCYWPMNSAEPKIIDQK